MKIPYDRLYRAYAKDRKEKGRPAVSEEEFRKNVDAQVKKDKDAFRNLLEAAGWRVE